VSVGPGKAAGPPVQRARARELGIRIGSLPAGPTNSLVDVPGVRVGHATVWRDEPDPPRGRGVARTGVTVIVPAEPSDLLRRPMAAGAAVLNGAGELTGFNQIEEWGIVETPVYLTSTMAVGRVYDAAVEIAMEQASTLSGDGRSPAPEALIPIVSECDDSSLNDTRRVQVDAGTVRQALAAARGADAGAPAVGAVGAGTGMVCHELKGGIGTASRLVEPSHRLDGLPPSSGGPFVVAALTLTNYGLLERLTVDGVPVGRALLAEGWTTDAEGARRPIARVGGGRRPEADAGSCIVVLVTDAPLDHHQLTRLARRAGLGLARTGSYASHGSGEIFIALSTRSRPPRSRDLVTAREVLNDDYLGALFAAAVEATEEAAIDSLVAADEVTGRNGLTVQALPLDRLRELLEAAGRSLQPGSA
jgi:D-aminopeptidase